METTMTDDPRDARVDAYIANAAPFARAILERVREIVHSASPDVVETIKWGMPFFESSGRPLCHMAAFKQHAALGFWLGQLVTRGDAAGEAMGQFGRLTSIDDLPPRNALVALIKKAIVLSAAGVKSPARTAKKARDRQREAEVPADLDAAFGKGVRIRKMFDALTPSQRREYIDWINDAKRDDTRAKRVATTLAQVAAGRSLNSKYRKP